MDETTPGKQKMRFNVGTIASRIAIIVTRETGVITAARLMREHHVGSVLVVREDGGVRRPIGIVTDRDLVLEVMAQELDPVRVTVGDVMNEPLVTATESDTVFDAVDAMRRHGVRRLAVIDDGGALVGVVAMDDILSLLAEELGALARTTQFEITTERKQRASTGARLD